MLTEMNNALERLTVKYAVPSGKIVMEDGKYVVGAYPLLPWRVERRFIELKSTVTNGTLEDLSTLRFSSMTGGENLVAQVVRELDLAAWMVDDQIVSLYAACADGAAANVVAKLANSISLSVECSNKLPAGAERMDRHEIIARRGIASDRVVDTQVPQSSIYAFTAAGEQRFTDTDAELFGLPQAEVLLVRAAFAVLRDPALGATWQAADKTMDELSAAIKESTATASVVTCGSY